MVRAFFILTVVSKHSEAGAMRAVIKLWKIRVPHRAIIKQLKILAFAKANPSHLLHHCLKKLDMTCQHLNSVTVLYVATGYYKCIFMSLFNSHNSF